MRKVDVCKRFCLQKSFLVLLVFCTMAISVYTLNGIMIGRSSANLYAALNMFPRSNRTIYVPGKVWRAKYRLNPVHWSNEASLLKTENKNTSLNKSAGYQNRHTGFINEILKNKNENTLNRTFKNVHRIQDGFNNLSLVKDLRKIGNFSDHSKDPVSTILTNASSGTEIPIFDSFEHETYIRKLLVRGQAVLSVDCHKLINKDIDEINKANQLHARQKEQSKSLLYYDTQTQNCETFKRQYGYITSPLTAQERDFPIAYSILMYKDVEQVERLLRAIYRPQNFYCIHIDSKAKSPIRKSMINIAKCFDNVFIASRSVDVQWGQFSVLEPELICMQDLWHYKKWKYFINLTGQEFPLKTNYELVKILTAYNGSNDLEGTLKRANTVRWRAAGRPPHNIRPTKGAVHVIVQRGFVDYVLHSAIAKDFLNWVKKVDIPDETFFSTLNHNSNLKVPGSYLGAPETGPLKPFLARYKLWVFTNSPFHGKCNGKWVHAICIFGVRDLPELVKRKELFANKFHLTYQPFTQRCLGEWIFNKTRDYFFKWKTFDTSYYEQLDFVKHKV